MLLDCRAVSHAIADRDIDWGSLNGNRPVGVGEGAGPSIGSGWMQYPSTHARRLALFDNFLVEDEATVPVRGSMTVD